MKTLEAVVPKLLVIRNPISHRTESVGDEVVVAFAAVPLLADETGIEQDAKVLGNGRSAHLEMAGNGVDRAIGLEQEIENPAARGMPNSGKDICLTITNCHHGRHYT